MTEAPRIKRIEDYPAGTVIITKPADPAKLEALRKEKARIKKINPNAKQWQFNDESKIKWKGKLV